MIPLGNPVVFAIGTENFALLLLVASVHGADGQLRQGACGLMASKQQREVLRTVRNPWDDRQDGAAARQ